MKKLEKMSLNERDEVWLKVVGDFKKYSLTPQGRKDPEHGQVQLDQEDGDG